MSCGKSQALIRRLERARTARSARGRTSAIPGNLGYPRSLSLGHAKFEARAVRGRPLALAAGKAIPPKPLASNVVSATQEDRSMPISGPTTDHDEIRHWAEKHHAVPTEILPQHLNREPFVLRMMLPQMAGDRKDVRVLTWDEFLAKFALLGLTFVYDNNSGRLQRIAPNRLAQPSSEHLRPADRPTQLGCREWDLGSSFSFSIP